MNYVESLNLFGVEAKEIPCIKGSGVPTESTVGAVGLLYMDIDTGDMYKCTAENGGAYTWNMLGDNNDPDRHSDYFMITDDGLVALKPEYRGESGSASMVYSHSDMGNGIAGSRNSELPKHLVIPEVVDGKAVYGLVPGMFCRNLSVVNVTLPISIDSIPERCFNQCFNLKNLYNTENIKSVGAVAFQQTSLKRARFSKLEQLGAGSFNKCGQLIYADVGNITSIDMMAFTSCINLGMLKSANKITSVGQYCFSLTPRLRHADFISGLTNIGQIAFLASGIDYDWSTLSNCTFAQDATPMQYNPTDYWSNCTFTPCENRLPTKLAQDDLRWINRQIGTSGVKYDNSCILMCLMHAYCGLHNVTIDTVMDFENIVNTIDSTLLNSFSMEWAKVKPFGERLGLTITEYTTINQSVLQTLYDALADGAYAIINYLGKKSSLGHCALAYGINAGGELLILDSESYFQDDSGRPGTYSLPFYKACADNYYNVPILQIISL